MDKAHIMENIKTDIKTSLSDGVRSSQVPQVVSFPDFPVLFFLPPQENNPIKQMEKNPINNVKEIFFN